MKEGLIAFLKLIVFIVILPVIFSFTLAFQTQFLSIPASKEAWLLWGMLIYVVINLFLYTFKEVFVFGQQTTGKIFSFYPPLGGVAGYLVPIYSLLVILGYFIWLIFGKDGNFQGIFFFAIAFTLAMHLIMTAHELYEGDKSPLKAQYFLGFGLLYVVNIFIFALILAWIIPEFSIIAFFKSLWHHATHFYKHIYQFLFVDR